MGGITRSHSPVPESHDLRTPVWGPRWEGQGLRTQGGQDREGLPRDTALEEKDPPHSQISGFGEKLWLTQAFDSQSLLCVAMTWPQ